MITPRRVSLPRLVALLAALQVLLAPHAARAVVVGLPDFAPAPPSCMIAPSAEPPGLYRDDAPAAGRVVLTFDDGPYPDRTARVLDILERQRMSATFFVLGRHITARSYHLLQRMEVEGHVIGSHSYDHDLDMAYRGDAGAVAYIRGQHEVTRVLIELALLARSPADFDALAGEVLGVSPERRLPSAALEGGAVEILERHRSALAERGYPGGRYPVRYSRPPGGGPYLGRSQAPRARYDAALAELGMLNVLWHRLSGDVDASRAREYGFLTANVTAAAGRGGVLLLHDFIRSDALERALGDIARDPTVAVVGIDEAVADKYRCPSSELTRLLDERRGLLSSARLEAQRTLIIG